MEREILNNLLSQLEFIERKENIVSFKVRDVNTPNNLRTIKNNYSLIRKIFNLPNAPSRKPKKFVSQTIIQICRSMGDDCEKCTKYYKCMDKITTTGHYKFTSSKEADASSTSGTSLTQVNNP